MKTKEIRDLVDFLSKTGLNEVNIETEELKLSIKRDADKQVIESHVQPAVPAVPVQQVAPAAPEVVAPAAAPEAEVGKEKAGEASSSQYVEIKSPMIGTFYRSPNPESGPFIEAGDPVNSGQTVCIIEAMKLFNEIESEISGTIVKVLVEDKSPVEYDQPLFLVDPS